MERGARSGSAGLVEAGADEHEALCMRCGRCCHRKLLVGDRVLSLDVPCRHLDTGTRLCRVYGRRHEVNPECLTVPEGIERGVFPADCPYVAGIAGYVPPVENPDPELVAELVAELEAEEVGSEEPGAAVAGRDCAAEPTPPKFSRRGDPPAPAGKLRLRKPEAAATSPRRREKEAGP